MKIKIKTYTDEEYGEHDAERMFIDGKGSLIVQNLGDCPEDATIARDLVSCQQVYEYMLKAHKAGAAGEPLEYEVVKVKNREDLFLWSGR